jgi:hypothetical protein
MSGMRQINGRKSPSIIDLGQQYSVLPQEKQDVFSPY